MNALTRWELAAAIFAPLDQAGTAKAVFLNDKWVFIIGVVRQNNDAYNYDVTIRDAYDDVQETISVRVY